MKDICTITKSCYRDFAEQIAQKLEQRSYATGVFYSNAPHGQHRLEVSIIAYRNAESGEIVEISEIWWDSYTIIQQQDGEPKLMINDFDFSLLRKELLWDLKSLQLPYTLL